MSEEFVFVVLSSIGAVSDGAGAAINCSAASNYIMTPTTGLYSNFTNLVLFSTCSKNAFKSKLLSPNKTY